jgi:enamine deaminase RidA (YjgF/YER057c/UK114 family)
MGYICDLCRSLGHELEPVTPRGRYRTVRRDGSTLYVSGQVSRQGDEVISGPATDDLERARHAARAAALRALSVLDADLADNERARLLKLVGYVMSGSSFTAHSAVLDAASEVFLSVLGEDAGAHARTAIGVASLPGSGLVELDLVCAVDQAE